MNYARPKSAGSTRITVQQQDKNIVRDSNTIHPPQQQVYSGFRPEVPDKSNTIGQSPQGQTSFNRASSSRGIISTNNNAGVNTKTAQPVSSGISVGGESNKSWGAGRPNPSDNWTTSYKMFYGNSGGGASGAAAPSGPLAPSGTPSSGSSYGGGGANLAADKYASSAKPNHAATTKSGPPSNSINNTAFGNGGVGVGNHHGSSSAPNIMPVSAGESDTSGALQQQQRFATKPTVASARLRAAMEHMAKIETINSGNNSNSNTVNNYNSNNGTIPGNNVTGNGTNAMFYARTHLQQQGKPAPPYRRTPPGGNGYDDDEDAGVEVDEDDSPGDFDLAGIGADGGRSGAGLDTRQTFIETDHEVAEGGGVASGNNVLADDGDDEMDGKPMTVYAGLENRSNPEVSLPSTSLEFRHGSISHPQHSSDLRNTSLDSYGGMTVDKDGRGMHQVGLSSVPNQYCTLAEAVDLRKIVIGE